MIDQATADSLINMDKEFVNAKLIAMPMTNEILSLNVKSKITKDTFLLDINRKGTFKLTRFTYQERYRTNIILLRLDIDTKPHVNPNGEVISPTHIHIYREGYLDKWAYPLEGIYKIDNQNSLLQSFINFCKLCNIDNIPCIQDVIE